MDIITLYCLLIAVFVVMEVIFICALLRYGNAKKLAPFFAEKQALQTSIDNSKEEMAFLRQEVARLSYDKDAALEAIQHAKNLSQQLKDQEKKLLELTGKVAGKERRLQELTNDIEHQGKIFEAAQQRLSVTEEATAKVQQEASSARMERDDLKNQAEGLRQTLQSQHMTIEEHKKSILNQEEILKDKKSEERDINNHLTDLKNQEIKSKHSVDELNNQCEKLKEELKKFHDLKDQQDDLKRELSSQKENLSELTKRQKNYEYREQQARTSYENMLSTKDSLERELQLLRDQKQTDTRELTDLADKLVTLRHDFQKEVELIDVSKREAQEQLEEFITQKGLEQKKFESQWQATLSEQNKMYASQQAALNAQLAALEENRKRQEAEAGKIIADIQKKIEEKRDELKHVTKQQEQSVAQLTQLKAEIGDIDEKKLQENQKKRWADLVIPVFHDPKEITENTQTEIEWLSEFKNNLKTCGVKFDDRIINAFHTSLKVADASPMVVLAGISGTGKSLLPQLYAQAMGMNFLTVAVQPRWDSPQDMFGFFNYMEGRYKATELSRLLWQYDLFNNPEGTRQYQERLPMNLVLLDEMNLAKVEYYFSDMLSKLEVRRTVNPKNEKERHQAEIELDGGAMAEKDKPRRLYVARNTLFVGTMNEDESTQALSDKVMDRANVMRFGYPQELETKPNLEKFRSCYGERHMTWERWSKNWLSLKSSGKLRKSSDNSKKLQNIMLDVNGKLAEIGRPFAHRVWQSMVAYVENYPVVEDSFKHAVADQFEMKILPKLNGVEKEDPAVKTVLGEIAGILQDNLKGEQIIDDFDKAKDNPSDAFFQWRGITR